MLKRKLKSNGESKREFVFFHILWSIIRKNIKIIQRSKSSSLIVLLGPLIIIILVGAAYNTSNIYDIRIGAYSEMYSELAESTLNTLGGQQFSVVKFDTKEECLDSLKFSQIHTCVVIPPNLEIGSDEPLNFHVDQSRVNLVWIIIDAMTSKLSSKSSEISLQLTTSIIGTLRNTGDTIKSSENTFGSLNERNENALDIISSVSSDLDVINYDLVSEVDLGKISQKLEETITGNNLSSGAFDPVFTTISNVKNKTENLGESLQNATQGAIKGLSSVQEDLVSNTNTMNELRFALGGLQTNINAATGQTAEDVVNPIKTHITPVVVEKTHLSFLFPTLIVLVVMLIGLVLSSALIIKEKTSSAFFRNYITPVSDGLFLLGHFLTNFIILFLQLAVIFIVAFIFFKGSLASVLWLVVIALIFIVSLFSLIGMFIGYMFRSEETAMLATISLGSLLLFFSSTILPLETLPESLKRIADFNPFVISEGILKQVMLFKSGFYAVYEPILILSGYILVIICLVYGAAKISKTKVE